MYKTLDAIYRHLYFCPLFANTCRLRVYETSPGHEPLPTVFIATQLPSNRGTSITNAAEELATEVIRFQRIRRGLDADDPRHRAVWVEHYPAGILSPAHPEERLSLVSFEEQPGGRLHNPIWKPVTRSFVELSLIFSSLED